MHKWSNMGFLAFKGEKWLKTKADGLLCFKNKAIYS